MSASPASVRVPAPRSWGGRHGIGVWYTILALAGLFGLVAWTYELRHGLASTGMRDVVSWGLYIFTFAFFIGLSAGGLIMASSAEVFGIAALKPLARLGVLSAAACVTVAAILIIPDLGQPARILNLVRHPNWSSPLVWDIVIITAYFVFSVVDLTVLQRDERQTGLRTVIRVLAYVGLPMAVLLHSVTAWIFGLQIARPWWNTALMAPLFVVSAILSGTALVTLLALTAQRWGGFSLPDDTRRWLRGLITIALIVDLFLVGCDYITMLWGSIPADRAALNLVLPGGAFAWTFWLEWIAGGLLPLMLLLVPRLRRMPGSLGLAAAAVVLGVYAFRIELVVVGFVNPLTQFPPGTALGSYTAGASSFQFAGRYSPTWVEYAIVAGLLALFGAIMTIGYRRLLRPSAVASGQPAPHGTGPEPPPAGDGQQGRQ